MAELEPLQVGVMFWTGGELGIDAPPADITRMVAELGVKCGQIGIHSGADLGEASRQAWRQALADEGLTVVTAFPGFEGESYADIPTVKDTVGFIPPATREAREARVSQ